MFARHTSASWARRLLSTFRYPVLAWGPGAVMCWAGCAQDSPMMPIPAQAQAEGH